MTQLVVTSSAAADATFSTTGATNWNAGMTPSAGILTAAFGGTNSAFFQVAGPSVARTYTFPDVSDTVAVLAQSNSFTAPQSIALGAITTALSPLSITETRNTVGTIYPGITYTITDTTSAAASMALQINGGSAGTTNLISVSKTGVVTNGVNGSGSFLTIVPTANVVGFGRNGSIGSMQLYGGTNATVTDSNADGCLSGAILSLRSAGVFAIGSTTNGGNPTVDTGLSRISGGVYGVGTGAAASVAGSISLTNLTTTATSSTGTAAILDGSNVLRPLTSSERFKTNIQEWTPSDKEMAAFLALPAIQFDYQDNPARIEPARTVPAETKQQPSPILDAKGASVGMVDVIVTPAKDLPAWEIEPARPGVKNVLGFSAEKIDAAGLSQLVNYDADGLPYSLREHGLITMLFAIIKKQDARITALEGNAGIAGAAVSVP